MYFLWYKKIKSNSFIMSLNPTEEIQFYSIFWNNQNHFSNELLKAYIFSLFKKILPNLKYNFIIILCKSYNINIQLGAHACIPDI